MERKNLGILTTSNLSSMSETVTQTNEQSFKTDYALIIIAVVIVIGNSFVLWTVKSFSKRLVADIFISSLALLDITHTMTSILLAILFKWTLLQQQEEFTILCKIQAWFTVTTQTHSAFIVTLINVERLTAVSRPFFYKSCVNTHSAVKILILLLFVSICIASLPLIAWGNYVLLPKMALCIFAHDSDYAISILVIGYADFLIVFYCFFAIKISLKKFLERQARFAARRGAVVDLQARGVALTKTASLSFTQSQRLLKVTAMVSGLFYFSWLPLMVSITRAQVTRDPSDVLNLISSLMPLASPLVNPLIYFFTWERYKKSYIRILKQIVSFLLFNKVAMFNKDLGSAIPRSPSSPFNLEDIERKKNTSHQSLVLANITVETPPLDQLGIDVNDQHGRIPTAGKSRSFSYDSSMSFRCLGNQKAETKRRFSFPAQNITAREEILSEKHVQDAKSRQFENIEDHYEVSSKILKHDMSNSCVTGNEVAKRDNLGDKCLITERLNQYLKNVVNDQDLEVPQKRRRLSEKQLGHKKRWNGSRKCSQKSYESSSNKDENKRNFKQKPGQFHSRNRHKYSRKHYWEEFEDFRNKLDDDVRYKLQENHKQTEKAADSFQETSEICEISNKAKGEATDQIILRILPKSHEFSRRHGSISPKISHRNHSKKRKSLENPLELNRVPKSKSIEASIWTFL